MSFNKSHTDDDLVLGVQAGSEEAFALLYKKYKGKLMGYLVFKLKHPEIADEVFQISWAKVLDNIHKYRQESSFSVWLFTIATNSVKDWFKKTNNQKKLLEALRSEATSNFSSVDKGPSLNIGFLKPEARRVIELQYIEGLSSKEISTRMSLNESNIRKIASRARLEIKKHVLNGGDL